MIAASVHRTDRNLNYQLENGPSVFEDGKTPMWSLDVRSDIQKLLAVIERVEREEEMKVRRERKERLEAAAAQAAALAAQSAGGSAMAVDSVGGGASGSVGAVPTISSGGGEDGDGGPPKKKKKKDGPGVTARNMSEDVRKKMSNAVASQAAGLGTGKYAWMTTSAAAAAKPKPAPPAAAPIPATTTAPANSGSGPSSSAAGGWAKPYIGLKSTHQSTPPKEDDNKRVVTLRDAMFVVETERGHGGGRGAARGWT